MNTDYQTDSSMKKGINRTYVTVSDAAELLGVSSQSIRNWMRQGMLRGRKLNPKGSANSKLIVRLDDVNEILDSEDSYLRDIDIKNGE